MGKVTAAGRTPHPQAVWGWGVERLDRLPMEEEVNQAAIRLFSRSRARHRRERMVPIDTFSVSAASW